MSTIFKNYFLKTAFKNSFPRFSRAKVYFETRNVLNLFSVFSNVFLKITFICNALFQLFSTFVQLVFKIVTRKQLKIIKICYQKTTSCAQERLSMMNIVFRMKDLS